MTDTKVLRRSIRISPRNGRLADMLPYFKNLKDVFESLGKTEIKARYAPDEDQNDTLVADNVIAYYDAAVMRNAVLKETGEPAVVYDWHGTPEYRPKRMLRDDDYGKYGPIGAFLSQRVPTGIDDLPGCMYVMEDDLENTMENMPMLTVAEVSATEEEALKNLIDAIGRYTYDWCGYYVEACIYCKAENGSPTGTYMIEVPAIFAMVIREALYDTRELDMILTWHGNRDEKGHIEVIGFGTEEMFKSRTNRINDDAE